MPVGKFIAAGSTVLGSVAMEPHQDHIVLDVNVPVNMNVALVPPPLRTTAPSSSSSSTRRSIDCSRLCTRPGPFDSQPCILMEIAVSVILIVASIMVLALSRNEKPHSLITLWIVGYASGCLNTLPNLCLCYRRRLCIAIVATTFISYATLIIAFVCFLFFDACFASLFGYQMETRGASFETLSALPMYKFKEIKPTKGNGGKYDCENPSKNSVEDGIIAVDTVQERSISAKDAMCCICLRKYEDDEHLRELPCTHYFHVKCVDKWLIIKASCPLCKHEFGQ